MSSINVGRSVSDISPYGWVCNVVCAGGCGVGCGAGGGACSLLCFADGPAPFADAGASGAIASAGAGAGGLSGATVTGFAQGA